jgi:hypothetical protein
VPPRQLDYMAPTVEPEPSRVGSSRLLLASKALEGAQAALCSQYLLLWRSYPFVDSIVLYRSQIVS